jgi:hypothetical protein
VLSIPEDMEKAIMPKILSDTPESFPAQKLSEEDSEDKDNV